MEKQRKNPKTKKVIKETRCEGWRRYGGAFTLGPVTWEQCKNPGIVILTIDQGEGTKKLPACKKCWQEAVANCIKILKTTPI